MLVVTKDNRTDGILLEVQRHAEGVLREFEHFAVARVGQAVDAHDSVGNTDDGADIPRLRGCFEVLDTLFNQRADFRSFECHYVFLFI